MDKNTHNFRSSQVGAPETVGKRRSRRLGVLQHGGVLDQSKHAIDLLLGGLRASQSNQRRSSELRLASSHGIPRGFRREVCNDSQGDGPDPLERKGDSPTLKSVSNRLLRQISATHPTECVLRGTLFELQMSRGYPPPNTCTRIQ